MNEICAPRSRELLFYRREYNAMGARLLRLQEEQTRAFREARRSRTVVKLLQEVYRLGDLAQSSGNVDGPMLELLVDNTVCDRAMLLREEPVGSGMFREIQAIGVVDAALSAPIEINAPPDFLYANGPEPENPCAGEIAATIGVPHVLWAYDSGSGYALVIGNRSESSISLRFESGDQELIETALSVYLDVLYRKQAEAQLRQAKQDADVCSSAHAAVLTVLTASVHDQLQTITDLSESLRSGTLGSTAVSAAVLRDVAEEISRLARHVSVTLNDAAMRPDSLRLSVEWVPLDEVIWAALRSTHLASAKADIGIDTKLPDRRIAILADRARMQQAVQHLVGSVVRGTLGGGTVEVQACRRSDSALEVLLSSRGSAPFSVAHPSEGPGPTQVSVRHSRPESLSFARSIVEAHQGTLTVSHSSFGGVCALLTLPAECTRDIDLSTM